MSPQVIFLTATALVSITGAFVGTQITTKRNREDLEAHKKSSKESDEILQKQISTAKIEIKAIEKVIPTLVSLTVCGDKQGICANKVLNEIDKKMESNEKTMARIEKLVADLYEKHDQKQIILREISGFMGDVQRYMKDHNGDRTEKTVRECINAFIQQVKDGKQE